MKPKCFESMSQYEAWQRADMALNSTRHLRITQSETPVCADCTPTYAMAMRAQGRCEHPETIFKKTGEEFIGVIPIVVIPPPVILLPRKEPKPIAISRRRKEVATVADAAKSSLSSGAGIPAVCYGAQHQEQGASVQAGSIRLCGSAVSPGWRGTSGADDHAKQHERADKEDSRV